MPYFRVMMKGTGIKLPTASGAGSLVGFFTTRVARAASRDDAVEKIKAMIIKDWTTGEYAAANQGSIPVLTVESIRRDAFLDGFFFRNGGHVFYPDREGEDEDEDES